MSEESRLGREQIETAYALKQITGAGVRVFFYLEDRERTLETAMDKVMLSLNQLRGRDGAREGPPADQARHAAEGRTWSRRRRARLRILEPRDHPPRLRWPPDPRLRRAGHPP
jgi:hypothetical protein